MGANTIFQLKTMYFTPLCPNISSGVSHSDGSCVLGRIHSDVSSNIPKKVYHIVTDNFVNLLHISYAWLYKTECWGIKFQAFSFNSQGIVKYLWQILILYSIQFAYPTYSGSPFSDEIAIMIRHYVIHPYLKIRHYVIHPTIFLVNFLFNLLLGVTSFHNNTIILLIILLCHINRCHHYS